MANAAKMKDNPFFVEYVAYEWKEEQKMGDSIPCTGSLCSTFKGWQKTVLFWKEEENYIIFEKEMESESTFDVVKRLMLDRRSVRKYLDKEIPMDELKEVLTLAQERHFIS